MRRLGYLLFGVTLCFFPTNWVAAQDQNASEPEITAPEDGDALLGSVAITGSTASEGFISWELAFGYIGDTTGSWFLITESEEPIQNGVLATWDTTTIIDGDYNLRLTIYQENDRRTHLTIANIRVRNYSAIETYAPPPDITSTPSTQTLEPTHPAAPTPSVTNQSETPTPLPTNPINITQGEISNSLVRGALGTLTLFLLLGLYLTIKKAFQS